MTEDELKSKLNIMMDEHKSSYREYCDKQIAISLKSIREETLVFIKKLNSREKSVKR